MKDKEPVKLNEQFYSEFQNPVLRRAVEFYITTLIIAANWIADKAENLMPIRVQKK